MTLQTPPVVTVPETLAAGPPVVIDSGSAPDAPSQTSPDIYPQKPAVQKDTRKRKRMVNIDDIANVIPEEYEAAWKKIRTHIEEISVSGRRSTLAPSSLESPNEALRLFNLRESSSKPFGEIRCLPIPEYLKDNIARTYSVTGSRGRSNNEAFSRVVLDQILISCLFEEGQRPHQQQRQVGFLSQTSHAHPSTSDTNIQDDPAKLELLHEMPLSKLVTHEGETKLLSGFADYSVC